MLQRICGFPVEQAVLFQWQEIVDEKITQLHTR